MEFRKITKFIVDSLKTVPENVWVAGFSGGKDSSLLVDLLVETIAIHRPYTVLHVVYADTLLEYPMVRDYAYKYLGLLREYVEEKNLRIYIHYVTPEKYKDFIYLQLVKGYPMPHRRFRWCTEKLKIIPAKKVVKRIIEEHGSGNVALFNGSRLDESIYRSRLLRKRVRNSEEVRNDKDMSGTAILRRMIGSEFTSHLPLYFYASSNFGSKLNVYSPLAYVTEEDVWKILLMKKHPFFTNEELYIELSKLYGRSNPPHHTNVKVRFGCWLCTVATVDKSGEYLATIDNRVEILRWARKALFLISHGDNELFRNKPRFKKQKYGSLNKEGKLLTQTIYHIVYKKYPEAFKSYINYKQYNYVLKLTEKINYEKAVRTAKKIISKTKKKEVAETLKELINYLNTLKRNKQS